MTRQQFDAHERPRPRLRSLDVDALLIEVDAYEAKYGFPSERMFDSPHAFPFGRETNDGRRWVILYNRLQRATGT